MRSKDRRRGRRSLTGLGGSALPLDDGLRPNDMRARRGANRFSCAANKVLMPLRYPVRRGESWPLLHATIEHQQLLSFFPIHGQSETYSFIKSPSSRRQVLYLAKRVDKEYCDSSQKNRPMESHTRL